MLGTSLPQPYGHLRPLGVGALSFKGTNMIDEIQHLRVGFSVYAASKFDGVDGEYIRQSLQENSITFAKTKRGSETSWEFMKSSIWGLNGKQMLAYRKGPVYEVETKQRSVYGKLLKPEKYLDFYDDIPKVCISQLPSYKVRAWLDFENLEDALTRSEAQGIEIARSVAYQVEGRDRVRVEIALDSAQHLVFFMRCYALEKHVSLIAMAPEPEQVAPALLADKAPIYTETMSLF